MRPMNIVMTVVVLLTILVGARQLFAGAPNLPQEGTTLGSAARTICVAHANGSAVDEGSMQAIRQGLENARQLTHAWNGDVPTIQAGCPSGTPRAQSGPIEKPGTIEAYIFLLEPQALASMNFRGFPRQEPYEEICSGDSTGGSCNEVATSLYLATDELTDEQKVVATLIAAMGMNQPDDPRNMGSGTEEIYPAPTSGTP